MRYGCKDARGVGWLGAGLAAPLRGPWWQLLQPWGPLQPSSISWFIAVGPFLWQKYLSASLSPPAACEHWRSWSCLTALGCEESLVLVYRP